MEKRKLVVAKSAGSIEIDAKRFASFLSKVYLQGLLNECIISSVGDQTLVSSIDPTNIIFLSIQEDIDISALGDLGLGDIQIVHKFISDCPTDKLKLVKKANRMIIAHSGIDIEYLLTDPTLITTSVNSDKFGEIIQSCEYSFKLTKQAREAFLYSTNLLKVKTASIVIENGKVFLTGGLLHEHNFKLNVGTLENGPVDTSFVCSFYADYIKAVFSVLDFKDYEEPEIIFSPDYPMVVQEGANSWAVFPLTLD